MRKSTVLLVLLSVAAGLADDATERIRVNQIGFYPQGPKSAVVIDPVSSVFSVISETDGSAVYTGTLGPASVWNHSQENAAIADFSGLEAVGVFRVRVEGIGDSWPFEIKSFVHESVAAAALKSYYYQRASMPLDEAWAGKWRRAAGHPDTSVWVHASAATETRPEKTVIRSPKGWYDAGDYNKYIVNSGITMWTLLAVFEHFPEYAAAFRTDIPESGNGLPDLLDEILWNLRWMLTMQDPDDGGVYHKCTNANFDGFVMPNQARTQRYVVQKSVTATLDFAAVMAQAARVLEAFDAALPGLADSCLFAAEDAWMWAADHPNLLYNQTAMNTAFNPDINTGAYGDGNAADEFDWAAAEMYLTTGEAGYLAAADPFGTPDIRVPSWPNVATLGILSMLMQTDRLTRPGLDDGVLLTLFLSFCDGLVRSRDLSAYGVVMGTGSNDFVWGSNAVAANQALCLLVAHKLTGEADYFDAALSNLDYCLGRNATGYSFVTGHGDKTPMRIHHRQSGSDGIADPVPGFLAGGPNPSQQDRNDGAVYTSNLAAKSYSDMQASYASNENCINWNAPLVYILFGIEALMSETGLPSEARGVASRRIAPLSFRIEGNWPNPFNSSTRISYSLDGPANVRLTVCDAAGRTARTLESGMKLQGRHEIRFNASDLPSGVYFIRLQAGGRSTASRMLVLK
ncbi:glycoside hydrolase family 9 protein [bacterium]|nr:glycoside hydrolase family 9 protein [bacterium]